MNVSDKNQNEEEPNSKAADQLIDSLLKNAAANPEGGDDEAFLSHMEGLLDAEPGKEKPGKTRRPFLVMAGGIAAAVVIGFMVFPAFLPMGIKVDRVSMEGDSNTSMLIAQTTPDESYAPASTRPESAPSIEESQPGKFESYVENPDSDSSTADKLKAAKVEESKIQNDHDRTASLVETNKESLAQLNRNIEQTQYELAETEGRITEIDLAIRKDFPDGYSHHAAGSLPANAPGKNETAERPRFNFKEGESVAVAGADGSETSTGINVTGAMGSGGNVSAASVNSPPGANQSHLLATTGSDETQSAPGKVQVGYPPSSSGLRAGSNPPGAITGPAPVTPVFENFAKRGSQTRGMNDFERDNFRGATRRTVNPAGNQPMDATPAPDRFGRRILPPEESHPAATASVLRVPQLIDNPWMSPLGEPLSTFSIDVDTASWTNIRGMLERGMSMNQIPQDSVRIEEMINYFDWKYPQPDGEHPFGFAVESAACPWNADSQLLRVAIQGMDIQRTKRPASNLVFLLDVSGSMNQPNKLPLVKKAISVLVEELNENDCVSVVVYAGAEGVALYPTKGNEQAEILSALDHLQAGGSTNGGAGINLAYKMAAQNFIKDGTNRVILCTDGDFNVGLTGTETLTQLVERKAKKDRVFLSVCGFGNDNLNDAMLESITNKGNGTYYFIDTFAEARKVFLKDMMATLVTIAKDVKIQVEFNPGQVKAYRLIGYANRRLAAKDFEDDRVDAGEIGAGHSVTAFYEIVPADSKSNPLQEMTSNLRYQKEAAPEPAPQAKMKIVKSPELALLKLRYKAPDGDVSKLVEQTVMPNGQDWRKASRDYRFASAVALFGMKLRGHDSVRSVEIPEIIAMAEGSMGNDPHGYRAEFVRLLKKAAK